MAKAQSEFGQRLRAALKAAGLGESPTQLADLVAAHGGEAATVQAAHSWIRGVAIPRPGNLKALARALNTTQSILLGDDIPSQTKSPGSRLRNDDGRRISAHDQRAIDNYLALPPKGRALVADMVAGLAKLLPR